MSLEGHCKILVIGDLIPEKSRIVGVVGIAVAARTEALLDWVLILFRS